MPVAHPHRYLRRDADCTLGNSASGLREHLRNHRAGGNEQGADRRNHAAFVAAAKCAQAAGFDCVEIHAAHGYLISQSHAPFENHRTDEYGGSLENRTRFGLDVLRAVKKAVPETAVAYRLSVEDYFPGGLPYSEGRQIALWAAAAGADALHIS